MDKLHNNKKEVFTVPDGYFEQLNRKIISATVESHTTTPRRNSHILGKFRRITGYAAAIAVISVLATNIITPGKDNGSNNVTTDSSYSQNEYIDNILNSYTIDDYTFYCYLTDTDIE